MIGALNTASQNELQNLFLQNAELGLIDENEVLALRMQEKGFSLTFLQQLKVLDYALILPHPYGCLIILNKMIPPQIQHLWILKSGNEINTRQTLEVQELFSQVLQKAISAGNHEEEKIISDKLIHFNQLISAKKQLLPQEKTSPVYTPGKKTKKNDEDSENSEDDRKILSENKYIDRKHKGFFRKGF